MTLIILTLCVLFFICFACLLYIFLNKNNYFCGFFNIDYKKLNDKNLKFKFLNLTKSYCKQKVNLTLLKINKPIFSEKILLKNKEFLLTISKFVDYKINNCKSTFRSINGNVLIDSISWLISYNLIKTNNCKLFSEYAKQKVKFSIRQKEDKIFKYLLAQKLLLLMCEIEREINSISKIIIKTKTANKIKKYKKSIYFSAEIYSIKKFNPNSTKLLFNFKSDINQTINEFLNELFESEQKLKIIITYLNVMFS